MRDWYLAGMGVVQYLPRDSYRAADVVTIPESSQALSEPQENLTAVEDLPLPPQSGLGQSLLKSIELVETAAEVAYRPEGAPSAEPVSATEATDMPAFRLACWQAAEDLLLIDSLEPAESVGAARGKLLANIVIALRHPGNASDRVAQSETRLTPPELIDWPDAAGDSSTAGARAMLAAFIEARIKMRGVCRVVVMGETAAELLGYGAIEETAEESAKEEPRQLPGGARACVTPALSQMLRDPGQKVRAWLAIRQLA